MSSPPVDLHGANLKNAKLNWTNVSGVNFAGANLEGVNFSNSDVTGASFSGANLKPANFGSATISSGTGFSGANIMEANFVASSGTPQVGGSLCNSETAFNSASAAYVFLLTVGIEGSFPLFFPVITLEFVPGWNAAGQCCFPVTGGIHLEGSVVLLSSLPTVGGRAGGCHEVARVGSVVAHRAHRLRHRDARGLPHRSGRHPPSSDGSSRLAGHEAAGRGPDTRGFNLRQCGRWWRASRTGGSHRHGRAGGVGPLRATALPRRTELQRAAPRARRLSRPKMRHSCTTHC